LSGSLGGARAGYGPGELARDLNVSRETLARFEVYAALIRRWQPAINLVGPKTLDDLWKRHFLDCGQLMRRLPASYDALYDIGSGAGFPGLVLALLGAHDVMLIESDTRKCAFLREAIRETGAAATVVNRRVEALEPPSGGWPKRRVLVARAVAPLETLLERARPLIDGETRCIMLKGESAAAEIAAARQQWTMKIEKIQSLSDPRGTILALRELAHV
jgi:16S rRNA (guanine527-N7)-methyltransferase